MSIQYRAALASSCLSCALFVSPALAGPEWVEGAIDAGGSIGTGQKTLGNGPMNSIAGRLGSAIAGSPFDFEDVYLLKIADPSKFSFTVDEADFDPQIFLFNVTIPGEGFGLLANDDSFESLLPYMGNAATDGTGAQINLPGVYAVAICGYGRNPISNHGNIFDMGEPGEVSGPDGPGGLNPLSGWSGEGETGSYLMSFTGVTFYDTPTPGAISMLALAAFIARPRRRKN